MECKRNETFGNVIFSPNVIQETWTLLQGTKEVVTRVGGAPPRAHPLPRGPLRLHRCQLQLYIFTFGEKKIREKDSSRFTIRSRRQALKPLGRADLESVRGSGEGDSSPSSSSTILHHQFHDAHRRA